jgi:hypothetical protein
LGRKFRRRPDFVLVGKEELPHLKHIRPRESTAESSRQVLGQSGDEFFPIRGTGRTLLFPLDNESPDFPIRGGHDGVHRPA